MPTMNYDKKPAKEVAALIASMAPVFKGKDEDTVLKACLAVAILMHKPKIEFTKLVQGIEGASEWIALWLMEPASTGIN